MAGADQHQQEVATLTYTDGGFGDAPRFLLTNRFLLTGPFDLYKRTNSKRPNPMTRNSNMWDAILNAAEQLFSISGY